MTSAALEYWTLGTLDHMSTAAIAINNYGEETGDSNLSSADKEQATRDNVNGC